MTKYIAVTEIHRPSEIVKPGEPIETSGEEEAFLKDAKAIRKMSPAEAALYAESAAPKAEKASKASKAAKPATEPAKPAEGDAGASGDDAGLV